MEHREHGADKLSGRGWIEAVMRTAAGMKKAPAGRGCPARAGSVSNAIVSEKPMNDRNSKVNTVATRMPWVRSYRAHLHNRIIMRVLSDREFKVWQCLHWMADPKTGALPCIDDIEDPLRIGIAETERTMEKLFEHGLLVMDHMVDGEPQYAIAGWAENHYSEASSTPRVRRHRAKQKQATKRVVEEAI